MVKVYSEYRHERVDYVFDFFLGYIRRDWTYVESSEQADIIYSVDPPQHKCLWLALKGDWNTLADHADDMYKQASQILQGKLSHEYFDLPKFVFHVLSRMEEYTPSGRDEHDRYKYSSSLLYKYDLLDRPVVDELIILFLGDSYSPPSEVCYTLDVDTAFYYLGKGTMTNYGLNTRDLLSLNFKQIKERWKVRTGRQIDPYQKNVQDFITQQKSSSKEIFWLASTRSDYDRQVSLLYRKHQKFLIETNNQVPISLHASYEAYQNSRMIAEEKNYLESIIERPILKNRFHYIRLKFPDSYRSLQLANIKEDWTMGYPDYNGFRAGTSRSFYWYDLERENQTSLRIVPFVDMDLVKEQDVKPFFGTKTKVYHNFEPINLKP